ncbi:hypothetical protein DSL72_006056 [Monilinia vaccinii-corymbosi]|uniref:Allergen n=1 Tax=Monilinia vaccinii-corymbosi TaxID=61207 RepID=A0A8A3PGP5_9HELO|nr:hypothetical protein DSL72_006056 [Monilinia vaccinii-corymbosi]
MDHVKATVSDFLSKDGRHDTTVHETIKPAVQHEEIIKTHHENLTTAIDREVHQDHYHTSVQPIHDREVLPEQHSHQLAAVEHRNIKHGNDAQIKERLAAEEAQFKNTKTVAETQRTTSQDATIAGEHVHHHVHETIQPVIEKETVQPSVVHTTIPIHEVHQNEAKHHTATALPAVSLDEFRKQGGSIVGREERTDAFVGEPKSVGGTLGGAGARGTTSLTEEEGLRNGHHSGTHSSTHESTLNSTKNGTHNSTHNGSHTGIGSVGAGSTTTNGVHHTTSNTSTSTGTSTGTRKKASLLDKINPMVDADGDGKAGFMK